MGASQVSQLWQLGRLVIVAAVGLGCAVLFHWHGLQYSLWYSVVASLLLCLGLFMAVFGIDLQEAKREWRVVALAVTVGVLCKYAFIFGALYLSTHHWQYSVLAMAMAQIDPLSVAALNNDQRMSPRTRTVLNMWASFDDPMTALATPLIVSIVGSTAGIHIHNQTSGASVYGIIVLGAGVVALLALRYKRGKRLAELLREPHHRIGSLTAIAAGTATRLYSMPAVAGLVFRPVWLAVGKRADVITNTALAGGTFLLGILLADGVDWLGGILLGATTFCSQIAVAWALLSMANRRQSTDKTSTFSRHETWQLAFAQQNGITAIVLGLNLEPQIPGAIASISLAIVTVNLLNFGVNWAYDRRVNA